MQINCFIFSDQISHLRTGGKLGRKRPPNDESRKRIDQFEAAQR